MKLNDIRMEGSEMANQIYQKRIDEIGINSFLKELKKIFKKNNFIKDSFDFFKKDLKCYPYASGKLDENTLSLIKTINMNKNNLPIFEIEDDEIEYKIKFPLIPFNKFYIATDICEELDGDLCKIGGFFVIDLDKDFLLVSFMWSNTIKDGWKLCSFLSRKNGLIDKTDSMKMGFLVDKEDEGWEFDKEINEIATKKFANLMKKLIYKINKKEYSSYKKYSYGNYIEKKITFDYDVRSHIRHFWDDTNYFNIPSMSKDELLRKGYGINELVFKDGQLRRDIPFKVIANFKIGIVKKDKNQIYDLTEKRIFRQEEKVLKILREIFPNDFIRRHDRKVLKGLELDFLISKRRVGFEYDGEQHFDRKLCEEIFKSDFDALKKRDREKDKRCKKKNMILIRIKYDEPLTGTNIKNKLKQKGIVIKQNK